MNATAAPTRPPLVPIDQVVQMLAGRAQMLAAELLPHGRKDGHEWRAGSLAGEQGKSLAVHLAGSKAGVWSDFSTGERGDALDLVAQCLCAGDKGRALTWARRWLGIEAASPADLETVRRQIAAKDAKADKEAADTRESAFKLWLAGRPKILGTPVDGYLVGRGLDLSRLGRQPAALRFHPDVWNTERQARLPAMVAAIHGADGRFLACHRTYLEQDGPGRWIKARLEQPKKVLGGFRGGMIRIWRGASGLPISQAPIGETVDVTEGIEDALTVAIACPESRVVAAVSLGNMGNLVFPPAIQSLCLWKDGDTNPKALAAFARATQQQLERGLSVLETKMPNGAKDANDMMLGKHHEQR